MTFRLIPDELVIILTVESTNIANEVVVGQELRFAYAPTDTPDIILWSNYWDEGYPRMYDFIFLRSRPHR